MSYYLPLPDCVKIKESPIHGFGLYATKKIFAGTNLGITHVKTDLKEFPDGWIRTPLGGFFNHSSNPNCEVLHEENFIFLKTLVDIEPLEEITAYYTLYNPENDNRFDVAMDFLKIIKEKCKSLGVKYLFPITSKVSYPGSGDIKVSGYFDNIPEPILACAIGKPFYQWLEILVHESCHMDQWLENSSLWSDIRKDGIDCDKRMDEWLGGKEYGVEEYTYFIRTMQAVELDCEKRSVEKIIKLNLPINVEAYVKKANSYLFFYTILLHTKKWCENAPYNVKEIIEQMPGHFLSFDEYGAVSDEILKIYKENCY